MQSSHQQGSNSVQGSTTSLSTFGTGNYGTSIGVSNRDNFGAGGMGSVAGSIASNISKSTKKTGGSQAISFPKINNATGPPASRGGITGGLNGHQLGGFSDDTDN
jgi:hypothetical protein